MLVLSRREGESLLITLDESADPNMTLGALFANGSIVIQIGEMKGREVRQAKVSIQAPEQLAILRGELS